MFQRMVKNNNTELNQNKIHFNVQNGIYILYLNTAEVIESKM